MKYYSGSRSSAFGRLMLAVVLVSSLLLAIPTSHTRADNAGYALAFDGVNDMLRLNYTSHMMASGWTSTKSVEFWVKPEGTAVTCQYNQVATCDLILGDRPIWWGVTRGIVDGQDRIWIHNYDGNEDQIGVPYTAGQWVHIAMVHSNGILQAYRNGVEIAAIPSGTTLQPHSGALPVLHIGGIIINSNRNFTLQGQIDEVRLWNTARSAAEIQTNMFNNLSGSENGLAAYYQMSNGSGTMVADDSLNNWDGTLLDGGWGIPANGTFAQWVISEAFGTPPDPTGTPSPTPTASPTPTSTPSPTPTPTDTPTPTPTPSPTPPPSGSAGFALAFDGVNDVVQLPATSQMMASTWTSTKSIELWVKPEGTAVTCAVGACDFIYGDKPQTWGISRGVVNGQDRIWASNFDGTVDMVGVAYTPNEWVHIALVHDGGRLRIYKNGVEAGNIASGNTALYQGANPVPYLGGIIVSSSRNYTFQGQIDEVRLWNTARSAAEIQSNMLIILNGDEAGLAAMYRMSDGAGTTLTDDSVNNWNGTLLDGGWGVPTNGSPALWVTSGAF